MAVTLGFWIDRLIITKLKNYYADNEGKKTSTEGQVKELCEEINGYIESAVTGGVKSLTFAQNKVYKQHTTEVGDPKAEMAFGELVAGLVDANHRMWVNQELLYNFETIPEDKRVEIVNRSCTLNIERNKYMDAIDQWFAAKIASNTP